jgi:membrane associated rhomboid family serine protease
MITNKLIIQFIISIYIVFTISLFFPSINLGIVPRTTKGLIGIVTSPFLHGGFRHIISNTVPLVVLLFILSYFYPQKALSIILFTVIVGGMFVWLFGRNANHIGASGLIYGVAAFLITNGFIEQKFVPLLISVGVIVLYGGLIWGILPSMRSYVSWESHLFGAIAGVASSFLLKTKL